MFWWLTLNVRWSQSWDLWKVFFYVLLVPKTEMHVQDEKKFPKKSRRSKCPHRLMKWLNGEPIIMPCVVSFFPNRVMTPATQCINMVQVKRSLPHTETVMWSHWTLRETDRYQMINFLQQGEICFNSIEFITAAPLQTNLTLVWNEWI